MTDMTFEDVAKAAEQLNADEHATLVERLQTGLKKVRQTPTPSIFL
jgi:hypothetical protein